MKQKLHTAHCYCQKNTPLTEKSSSPTTIGAQSSFFKEYSVFETDKNHIKYHILLPYGCPKPILTNAAFSSFKLNNEHC